MRRENVNEPLPLIESELVDSTPSMSSRRSFIDEQFPAISKSSFEIKQPIHLEEDPPVEDEKTLESKYIVHSLSRLVLEEKTSIPSPSNPVVKEQNVISSPLSPVVIEQNVIPSPPNPVVKEENAIPSLPSPAVEEKNVIPSAPSPVVEEKKDDFTVGSRVAVNTGHSVTNKSGTIRFVGETSFREGLWYGIELDEAVGKRTPFLADFYQM